VKKDRLCKRRIGRLHCTKKGKSDRLKKAVNGLENAARRLENAMENTGSRLDEAASKAEKRLERLESDIQAKTDQFEANIEEQTEHLEKWLEYPDVILSADNLKKYFVMPKNRGSAPLKAVDGVDLAIYRGETLGIVGESGCGKSTVARVLIGLTPLPRGQ